MKNTIKMLLASAALAVPSTAFAAGCNLGDQNISVTPKAIGMTLPVNAPVEVASHLYNDGGYKAVKAACTKEQVISAFNSLNGSGPIALEQPVKVPVLIVPAAKTEPVAVTVAEAPTTQVVPKTDESQELARLERERQAIAAERQSTAKALAAMRSEINARGANAPQAPGEVARMTAFTTKDVQLEAADRSLAIRITELERQIALKADLTYVDSQDTLLQNDINSRAKTTDVYTRPQIDQMFANFVGGIDGWFWWLVVLGVPLALLLHLRSAFAAFGQGVKNKWNAWRSRGEDFDEFEPRTPVSAVNDLPRDTFREAA